MQRFRIGILSYENRVPSGALEIAEQVSFATRVQDKSWRGEAFVQTRNCAAGWRRLKQHCVIRTAPMVTLFAKGLLARTSCLSWNIVTLEGLVRRAR